MKRFTKLLAALSLAVCLPAAADFTTVERAYEVPLSLYRAPATSAGSLAFKQCDSCDLQVIRVNPATNYVFNREPVKLAEFRKALSGVNNRSSRFVIILHHLESDTVTSVTLNL